MKYTFLFLILASVLACIPRKQNRHANSIDTKKITLDTATTDPNAIKTGPTEREKAMDFKSIASFKKGMNQQNMEAIEDAMPGKTLLLVLYESGAPWAINAVPENQKTDNKQLNTLIEGYKLKILRTFELDEFNLGMVLQPEKDSRLPVEAARELSMVDHVLMVHLKEVPNE